MIALVLAMVWTRRGQAVTLALLTLFGVAAAVAAPAYLRAADRAVAADEVSTADAASRSLTLIARQHDHREGRSSPEAVAADVDLPGTGATLLNLPSFTYTYASEFPAIGMEPDDHIRTRVVYRQDVCAHLTMTAGRCLIGESDMIIGAATAERLHLAPGDEVHPMYAEWNPKILIFEAEGQPKRFLVTGVYRATDAGDPYWGSHNYFGADTGGRPGEPAFVTNASVAAMDHGAIELSLDGAAAAGALSVDQLPAVRSGLASLNQRIEKLGDGIQLETGIPALLGRIDSGRDAAHQIVPVLAVCLVLLACLTIYLAVGYGTEGRRPELAVVALRGARWGQRWWLATGENLVSILVGAILGCVAGQLLVDIFAAWRFPGVGADPGLEALRWAPAAAGAAIVTALLAERRQLGRPVAELLRRVPPAPRAGTAVAAEAVVVLLAVVAVVQLAITGGGLTGVGTFATGLVLVAAALVAARLVLPWATVYARRRLRDGRLAAALAAFQVSRRPGGARLFALLTAAVAVIGYAACAVDVGARGRSLEAGIGIGASRVVAVGPVSRQGLLAAVRTADPSGAYAMAAVRLPAEKGLPAGIAVDTSRAAAIASWGGFDPARVEAALHPETVSPLLVRGGRLTFDLTASKLTTGKSLLATVILAPVAGPADEAVELEELRAGRHRYAADVPACASGCRVKAFQLNGREGSLDVTGAVTIHSVTAGGSASSVPGPGGSSEPAPGGSPEPGPGGSSGPAAGGSSGPAAGGSSGPAAGGSSEPEPGGSAGPADPVGIAPEVLGVADRWRVSEGGKLSAGASGLGVEITSLNGLPRGVFVQPAGVPSPLPVATAGDVASAAVFGLDLRALPIASVLRLPAVPGVGTPAVLADLDYADRLSTDAIPTSNAQVWLSPEAPADILDRLRSAGLVVATDTKATQVRARLDEQGPALALWFYVLVGALALALAAGALVLAAAVDRGRRIEDLSALRAQGLPRAAVRRATLWTYPVMVGAAVVAGMGIALLGWWLTGWALPLAGLSPPALPFPSLPGALSLIVTAVLAFAVLSGVAILAGRRTLRAIR
ncbi:FtsX-like permease family protein [Actinoplanes sp. CA-142083]|uniref:FtsX-like permease family protein n=1 Tax=Actinoplanes sp. CA-142083 TaxID=3239903 RepID=UPI003D916419